MRGVFVSYRRDATAAWAGRIADRLRDHFGRRQIFIDVVDIEPGAVFPQVVERQIKTAAAFVAVMGPEWATRPAADGRPRLHDENDWVRRETSVAIRSGVTIIPVLVDHALMPRPIDVPADVRPLTERNAIVLAPSEFEGELPRLIRGLEAIGVKRTFTKRAGKPGIVALTAVAASLLLLFALWVPQRLRESRLRTLATGPITAVAGTTWERFEVTNERYEACVEAGVCDEPGRARGGERFDETDRGGVPVVAVRADQAAAFCGWIGRRLPTVSEWEVAATRDGTGWPWGSQDPDFNRVNAIMIPGGADGGDEIDPIQQDRIDQLAAQDSVTIEELDSLLHDVPREELARWAKDWPSMPSEERAQRLAQAIETGSSPPDGLIEPADVVAVTEKPLGATSPGGIHHLVGNAAEWSSTTDEHAIWDGEATARLWVVGGSFAASVADLMEPVLVRADEALDTIGFRCVE